MNTTPQPPAGQSTPWNWPPNAEPFYLPCVIAAAVASGGVIVRSIGPWMSFWIFTVDGLNVGKWGTTSLILGALSLIAVVTLLLWQRTPFQARWAVPLAWAVTVAAAGSLAVSLPIALRVLTLPSEQIFGVSIGAGTGWGLWLLIFCAVILNVTAAVVATQLGRKVNLPVGGPDQAVWANRWRTAAVISSAAIALLSGGYFAAQWDSGLDVKRPSVDSPALPGSWTETSTTTTSPDPYGG